MQQAKSMTLEVHRRTHAALEVAPALRGQPLHRGAASRAGRARRQLLLHRLLRLTFRMAALECGAEGCSSVSIDIALPLSPEAWAAVQQRVAAGKLGFVGLHSATDTGWPYDGPGETYTRFVNGHFAGHPGPRARRSASRPWTPTCS